MIRRFIKVKWIIAPIVATLFITACRSRTVPKNILTHKEMQSVVWDMMRADQFLLDFVLNKDSTKNKKDESIRMYRQVLAIHGLSHEDFQRNMDYYRSHPSLMRAVMDSISKMQVVEPTEKLPVLAPGRVQTDTAR